MNSLERHYIVVRSQVGTFKQCYGSTALGAYVRLGSFDFPIADVFRDDIEYDVDIWGNCISMNFEMGDAFARGYINPLDIVELWTHASHESGPTRKFVGECVIPPPSSKLDRSRDAEDVRIIGLKERLKTVDTGDSQVFAPLTSSIGQVVSQPTLGYVAQQVALASELPYYMSLGSAIPNPPILTSGYFQTANAQLTGTVSTGGVDLYQFLQALVDLAAEAGLRYTFGVNANAELFFIDTATAVTPAYIVDENEDPAIQVAAEQADATKVINAVRWHLGTANMRYGFAHYDGPSPVVADPITHKVRNVESLYEVRTAIKAVSKDVIPLKSLKAAGHYSVFQGILQSSWSAAGIQDTTTSIDKIYDDAAINSWIVVKAVVDGAAPYYQCRVRFAFNGSQAVRLSDIVAAHVELTVDSGNPNKIEQSLIKLDPNFNNLPDNRLWGAEHLLHANGVEGSQFYGYADGFPKIDKWLYSGDLRRYMYNSEAYDVGGFGYFDIDVRVIVEDISGQPPLIAFKDFQVYTIDKEILEAEALNEYQEPLIEAATLTIPGDLAQLYTNYSVRLKDQPNLVMENIEATQIKVVLSSEENTPMTYVSLGNELGSIYSNVDGRMQLKNNTKASKAKIQTALEAASLRSYRASRYNKLIKE